MSENWRKCPKCDLMSMLFFLEGEPGTGTASCCGNDKCFRTIGTPTDKQRVQARDEYHRTVLRRKSVIEFPECPCCIDGGRVGDNIQKIGHELAGYVGIDSGDYYCYKCSTTF